MKLLQISGVKKIIQLYSLKIATMYPDILCRGNNRRMFLFFFFVARLRFFCFIFVSSYSKKLLELGGNKQIIGLKSHCEDCGCAQTS